MQSQIGIQGNLLQRRARLAWTVMLASFTIFASACLSIPFGASLIIQNWTQPLLTSVTANQGTVAIVRSTQTIALLPEEPPREVVAGVELVTNAADSALILAYTPEEERLLLRGQVYGNTNLEVEEASAPYFRLSSATQQIKLRMRNGRLRLTVLPKTARPLVIQISTPQGEIFLEKQGQYSIDVDNEDTQVAVQSGQALIRTLAGDDLLLQQDERGILAFEGPPEGPLNTERNLIRNGDFMADLSNWIKAEWNRELADQPTGETAVINIAGEKTLRFRRVGVGHADTSIRQILNQDVTDYTSLRLLLNFRIAEQSLGVCGKVGSECPLTVRITYEDINGNNQLWEQSFYANGQIAADTPDFCLYCGAPYNIHVRVLPGRAITYEEDLLQALSALGKPPPRQLKSISLIVAGHSFETAVTEIALLAKE